MDLARYVEDLRQQLLVAARSGGDEAEVLAERLTAPLDAATRLVLLDALSAAADEITTDLAPGSVELRLRGRDPEFVVNAPASSDAEHDVTDTRPDITSRPPPPEDDGGTSRITLRLPEHLKLQIEEAAGRDGLSVNAWLVRATADALGPRSADRSSRRGQPGGQHLTGWVR